MSQKLPCSQVLVCIVTGTGDISLLQHCQIIPTKVIPWGELLTAQSIQFPIEGFQKKLLLKRNVFRLIVPVYCDKDKSMTLIQIYNKYVSNTSFNILLMRE